MHFANFSSIIECQVCSDKENEWAHMVILLSFRVIPDGLYIYVPENNIEYW